MRDTRCGRKGRSSGGPVDQHVGGRAFGWSAQVDASQILDLATKPDGELVARAGEFRERLLDVGSLEPHQHEAPHRSRLQSPSLPGKSRPTRLSSNPLRRSPMHAAAKSLPPCSLPGRIGNAPLNTAIGLFSSSAAVFDSHCLTRNCVWMLRRRTTQPSRRTRSPGIRRRTDAARCAGASHACPDSGTLPALMWNGLSTSRAKLLPTALLAATHQRCGA